MVTKPNAPKIHQGKASGLWEWPSLVLKIIRARDGVIVRALIAEITVEAAMVTANCLKKRPVMPLMNAHGTKTAHKTSVIARIGPLISSIALMVAVRVSYPFAICRSMFSKTTMASSTTMPIASTSPNREMLLRL